MTKGSKPAAKRSAKRLKLKKETIRDLDSKTKAGKVKGGDKIVAQDSAAATPWCASARATPWCA